MPAQTFQFSQPFGFQLRSLLAAANCDQPPAPKGEFETTAEYERKMDNLKQVIKRRVAEAVNKINSTPLPSTIVSYPLSQGHYDADNQEYTLEFQHGILLDDGFGVEENSQYIGTSYVMPGVSESMYYWLNVIVLRADRTYAQTLRARGRFMQVWLYVTAYTYAEARIGLVIRATRIEVRDPNEQNPVIWNVSLPHGRLVVARMPRWVLEPPDQCGVIY